MARFSKCILDESVDCIDCGECDFCDLDHTKICDNCMKCVTNGAEYSGVTIDSIDMFEDDQ